jgi:hypothetical protein
MRLSCIVPATDSPETLDRCLAAIRASRGAPEELVAITEPPGSGPAAARNAGAAAASGDVLAFVDSDVVVHPDAFERIRASFERDPGLTAVFGAYDDAPDAPDPVSGFRNLLHHSVHAGGPIAAETFWAGLGAVRRDAFASIGGFDAERFPASSVEDVELGMRLVASGHRIRLDPAILGTHLKRWTLLGMVRTDFARRGLPWARLVLESGRSSAALNLSVRHRAAAAASVAAVAGLLGRRPRLALVATLALVGLNARLYRLIWLRRGPAQALAAVPLHLIHNLCAVTAAAGSLAAHLLGGRHRG